MMDLWNKLLSKAFNAVLINTLTMLLVMCRLRVVRMNSNRDCQSQLPKAIIHIHVTTVYNTDKFM